MTGEIVPGNKGKENGVYQQVLVVVALCEEGVEQSIINRGTLEKASSWN